MKRFEGKVVVVTGGASGIGKASAKRFAEEGATLFLGDLDEANGRAIADLLGATFITTDVTDETQVEALINSAVEHHGRIDVIFNNVGVIRLGTLPDLSTADWKRVLDVDLNSVFYGCRAALAHMIPAGGGVIINTASISGLAGDSFSPSYNAAKAAVVNLTRSLAVEHADQGIRVNCVCPGPIATGFGMENGPMEGFLEESERLIPMARFGRSHEVAAAVAFLASDEASYITGVALPVDGGLTSWGGQPNMRRVQKRLHP